MLFRSGEELIALLSHNESLEEQRCTNIYQIATHHDWRYRIDDFCRMMNLSKPPSLQDDLCRLQEMTSLLKRSIS